MPGDADSDVAICGKCGRKALTVLELPEAAREVLEADPGIVGRLLEVYGTDPRIRAAVDAEMRAGGDPDW